MNKQILMQVSANETINSEGQEVKD